MLSLYAVTLMIWPLIYIGVKDGDLSFKEGIVLGFIWLLNLMCVYRLGVSWWWFFGPATALTIYAIIRVLGADAKTYRGFGGD